MESQGAYGNELGEEIKHMLTHTHTLTHYFTYFYEIANLIFISAKMFSSLWS